MSTKYELGKYVYTKKKTYLVHIIESEADFPNLFYQTPSYHVAKVIAHDYISKLELYQTQKVTINNEEVDCGDPTLIESIVVNIDNKITGKSTIHVKIYKIQSIDRVF
jgi:hypothetical protein